MSPHKTMISDFSYMPQAIAIRGKIPDNKRRLDNLEAQ